MKNILYPLGVPLLALMLLGTHSFCYSQQPKEKRINVQDFGAIPDDDKDDAVAIRKALTQAREQPGSTLYFSPGTYNFYDKKAAEIEHNAISGMYGERFQEVLFTPNSPYVIGLDLAGAKNLTIEAEGATILFEGWYEAISISNAQNITLKGLSIDYKRPPNTLGRVIALQDSSFDIRIDPKRYTMLEKNVTGRIHFHDTQKDRIYMTGRHGKKNLLNDSTIRIQSTARPALGDFCILRHSAHYRAAILIKESREINIQDVRIFSHPGMGIVGHKSENISMNNLQVIPREWGQMSTNTDATHFTSCKGKIVFESCKFAGQGDDCTNIHNYYYGIYPQQGNKNVVEIKVENADLHALSLDYPDLGDSLLLVDRETLRPIETYTVLHVDTSTQNWQVLTQLDKPFTYDPAKHYLTNISSRPRVDIFNNTVRSHLGRAFLIKTNHVHIKGNSIHQSTGTAIQLGAEAGWRESGPVEDILIENNWIVNCGYGVGLQDGTAINVDVSGIKSIPDPINKRIVIRENVIQGAGKQAIYIAGAEDVTIERNRISGTDIAVKTEHSTKVKIYDN